MKKTLSKKRKIIICVLSVILAVVLVVLGYAIYFVASYNRLPNNLSLTVNSPTGKEENASVAKLNTEYKAISYNIGFCAYTPDFGFFMDGGDKGRANSKKSVLSVLDGISDFLISENPDVIMIEEIDKKAHRSWKVNQVDGLKNTLSDYYTVYAQNWDCPFVAIPLTSMHGSAKTGIMTFSKFTMTSATRISLPKENSIMKHVDLDRCYTSSRTKVENGKELVIYTVHLSAYTSDGVIADRQLEILLDDMQTEYEKGNYLICGGDFNKDLLGDSEKYFGESTKGYAWAKPINNAVFNGKNLTLIKPIDENKPIPSCRNADAPINDKQLVLTVDGFIVSSNVSVKNSNVYDTNFAYSDHNPVYMTFVLE